MESHLLQMRGLKLGAGAIIQSHGSVASFTDAWIETKPICSDIMKGNVASFTDAWIETQVIY